MSVDLAWLLASLPATPIRTALAIVVLVAALLILRGFALSKEPGRPATVGVGLMAGILNGSMGLVGPPVILFYFSATNGRREMRHCVRTTKNPAFLKYPG